MATKHEPLKVEMYQQDNAVVEDNMNEECENLKEICSGAKPMNTSANSRNDPQPMVTESIQPNSRATNSLNSEPEQSPWQRILPIVLFDVGLRTWDIFGDLSLIIIWFIGHHYIYGTSMFMPLLLCFLSTAYKWYKLEDQQDKRWSWVFLLLQCWPQLRALRVIRKLHRGDQKAYEEKTRFYTELGSIEAFLESWPSVIIMTAIWAHAHTVPNWEKNCNTQEFSNYCAVFGGNIDSFGYLWFWITYSTSAFTASLGITKLLMIGPCPILPEYGRLGGMLTCSFFTHFLAVFFCLGTKGAFVSFCIGFAINENGNIALTSITCLVLTLAPIIFSFISIALATGCNKKFFRIILDYPSIWLLPAATFFVVGPENRTLQEKLCCKKSGKRTLLGVSSKLTFLNMILTLVMYIISAQIVYSNLQISEQRRQAVSLFVATLFISAIIFTCFCFCCCHCKCCYCLTCCQVNKRYIMIFKDTDEVLIRYQPDHF